MIDLLDLYNKGHRRFLFSDGVVREPSVIDLGDSDQPLRFSFGEGLHLWYRRNGTANIDGGHAYITGVADYPRHDTEPENIPEIVNLKRDDDGRWWLEIPLSATVEDIQKAQEVLWSKT